MTPATRREIRERVKGAAALLVEAAIIQARAEAPGMGSRYYLDLLEGGDHFYDEEFECEFWSQVAQQVAGQLIFG